MLDYIEAQATSNIRNINRTAGLIFWNGCIKNFQFALLRCDRQEQLHEYAASNEMFCLFYYHHSTPSRITP